MLMREQVVARLRSQMTRAQVVLFTGAGFSRGAKDRTGQPLPGVRELCGELATLLYPGRPPEADATLGELYAVALRRNKPALRALLEKRFSVDPDALPEYYRSYFTTPWLRVYTLNIDDLEDAASRRFSLARRPRSLSATCPDRDTGASRLAGPTLQVVHLNGLVGEPPESLTFSESQYAERIANHETWYARCAVDIRARPVVFIGTELREETLWQHMELRRRHQPEGSAVPSPGSVLVTPTLTAARADLLQSLNIDWYQGTAESFASDVLPQLAEAARRGFEFIESSEGGVGRTGIPLVSELAAERPSLSTEYLLGDEPHWADLIQGRAAARSSNAALLQSARHVLEGQQPTAIAVTGTAGTGKSTALMWLALELSNSGIPVLWIDRDSTSPLSQVRRRLAEFDGKVMLAVDDADIFGAGLPNMLRDLVPGHKNLLFVFAVRSGRLDDLIGPILRGQELKVVEHVVPNLSDEDIDSLIAVLDRHNRLGILKGAPFESRRSAFAKKAGRQLLVAMIEATSGERFEEKAETELDQLEGTQRFIYAAVSVVTSQRQFLTKDEILLAAASEVGDAADAINRLVSRHLITSQPPYYQFRARHRVIAEIVLERLQIQGQLKPVLLGIARAAASKVDPSEDRKSRSWRLLVRFTSHEFLLRLLGPSDARDIYIAIESYLASEYHYWLQRGSLEVEAGDVRLAEHFLNQARSLNEDHRIDTEYAYMLMRKALDNPANPRSQEWVNDATQLLEGVIAARGGGDYHPFHILGSQGLSWVRRTARSNQEKRRLLSYYVNVVSEGLKKHPTRRDLNQLHSDLQREILMTAVT